MEYFIICLTSLIISIITLFSGFGLGTVLMPVFALFFPLPVAIAATAVVHLANNIFKAILVGKLAKWEVVLKFGIPAAAASVIGALLLGIMSNFPPLLNYSIKDHEFKITIMGLIIGTIITISSLFELIPKFSKFTFSSKYLYVGGIISGFFGGISGNQGVFRSAFLVKAGLNKGQFIGTSVLSSIFVDVVRLLVYGWSFYSQKFFQVLPVNTNGILIAASLTAFLGSYIGSKLIDKVTFKTIQLLVGSMLLILGMGIATGLI
jgi:uncharacterized membrane protein YfcA